MSFSSGLESLALDLVKKSIIVFDKQTGLYVLNSNFLISEESFGFDSVAIKQKKNILSSRLDADLRSEVFRGTFLDIPLIASNMDTVCNADFCIELSQRGALGVMHRVGDSIAEVKKIADSGCKVVAASIGVNVGDLVLLKDLVDVGVNVIFIDVAHGYSDIVIEFGKKVKLQHPDIKLVLGNTVNTEIMHEVDSFADAIKIGIAQGYACKTKNTAGCTERQFSATLKFKEVSKKLGLPIISDGGIREPSHFVKSLAAGANSVMAGMVFARCPESAAHTEIVNGVPKKVYEGMASRSVQERWRGLKPGTCPEGTTRYLDLGESLEKFLERYSGALRSGISYAGGNNIASFQEVVEFVKLS